MANSLSTSKLRITEFWAFAESEVPLGEGAFPHIEAFANCLLSAKASRRTSTCEGAFT
jgi:hypothetical protein